MIDNTEEATQRSPAGAPLDLGHSCDSSPCGGSIIGRKRSRNDFDSATPLPPAKRPELASSNAFPDDETTLSNDPISFMKQLPSPRLTDSPGDHEHPASPRCASPLSRTPSIQLDRFAETEPDLTKTTRQASSPYQKTRAWIEATAAIDDRENQTFAIVENPCLDIDYAFSAQVDMPALKRQASSESVAPLSSCGDIPDSLASTDAKSNFYSSTAFPVLLERHGISMKDSTHGLDKEEWEFCKQMLSRSTPHPNDSLLDEAIFPSFCNLSHNKSEQWLAKNMHSHIFPAPELLALDGQRAFDGLIEGCDDSWLRMPCPAWGKRPQPDCTIAFHWSMFTNDDIRKLGIVIGEQSPYTARDEMFFPFMTREAKSDKQPLDQAHRQNVYNMALSLNAILGVYRRSDRLEELNGKVLGFSVSYDNDVVRMYAHHAETISQEVNEHTSVKTKKLVTTKYCVMIDEVFLKKDAGKDRWKPYDFFYNVCALFSTRHLQRIKDALSLLPDEGDLSFQSIASADEPLQNSANCEAVFKKPRQNTIHAELRKQNENLVNQIRHQQEQFQQQSDAVSKQVEVLQMTLSQQREDSKQQMEQQKQQMAQQKQQMEQQRQQMEQQRQQMEQQRQQMEQQLQEQSKIIAFLMAKKDSG